MNAQSLPRSVASAIAVAAVALVLYGLAAAGAWHAWARLAGHEDVGVLIAYVVGGFIAGFTVGLVWPNRGPAAAVIGVALWDAVMVLSTPRVLARFMITSALFWSAMAVSIGGALIGCWTGRKARLRRTAR